MGALGWQAVPAARAGRAHCLANKEEWLDIGTGEWDESGRQCWVRMDRVLEISEEQCRRQGTLFPERRFERIANRLRSRYHWA